MSHFGAIRTNTGNVLGTQHQMEPATEHSSLDGRAATGTALTSSRFYAFLTAQFLGAANDNAFRITLILFVLATLPDEAGQIAYSSLATALFPIPFLLFSPIAGYVSDRFRKDRVLFWTKCPEIIAMGLAAIGF